VDSVRPEATCGTHPWRWANKIQTERRSIDSCNPYGERGTVVQDLTPKGGGEVIRTLPFLSPTHLGYLTATIFSRLGLDHESVGLEGGFTWSLEGFSERGS
jgi:hypothetical protein